MDASKLIRRRCASRGVTHVRTRLDREFCVVANALAQHRNLDYLAIGIATYMLSVPEGTKVSIKALTERDPRHGEHAISGALRRLEAVGFLRRETSRLPTGRIVTRTFIHTVPVRDDAPEAVRVEPIVAEPAAPVRQEARASVREEARASVREEARASVREEAGAAPKAAPAPVRDTTPAPVRDTTPAPVRDTTPAPVRDTAPAPVRDTTPAPVRDTTPAPVRDTAPAAPAPTPPPRTHGIAAHVLSTLHREDPRLVLPERDLARLTPLAAAWLERDVDRDALRAALLAHLPQHIHRPAAFLAHRLVTDLPAPPTKLPTTFRAGSAPVEPSNLPDVRPSAWWHSCDVCERALRYGPGRCRDCQAERGAAADRW
ncbi:MULTISPECIES: hypothetical protein [Streptomyces]|uniref:Helix-turn-helix domain-containing protein n=1 Tax=Streptomyces evansiae TaxID=3075535 RepID=A0ABU2RC83_9ACTN|nr:MULTISPECIES: hypothetical protein [unclassified Streptomyces]MDT0412949.1 hypothetical protein [Streptomyces sp. DSM 41979]